MTEIAELKLVAAVVVAVSLDTTVDSAAAEDAVAQAYFLCFSQDYYVVSQSNAIVVVGVADCSNRFC